MKNNLGFLFVYLFSFFFWLGLRAWNRAQVFCPSARSAKSVCNSSQAKSGIWGLENSNKMWNSIGSFYRKLTLNTHSVPCAAWKSSCGPSLTAFTGSLVLISPFPSPLTLKSVSEQAKTLLVVGCFVLGQFAAPASWCEHPLFLECGSRASPGGRQEGCSTPGQASPGTPRTTGTQWGGGEAHKPVSLVGVIQPLAWINLL